MLAGGVMLGVNNNRWLCFLVFPQFDENKTKISSNKTEIKAPLTIHQLNTHPGTESHNLTIDTPLEDFVPGRVPGHVPGRVPGHTPVPAFDVRTGVSSLVFDFPSFPALAC